MMSELYCLFGQLYRDGKGKTHVKEQFSNDKSSVICQNVDIFKFLVICFTRQNPF